MRAYQRTIKLSAQGWLVIKAPPKSSRLEDPISNVSYHVLAFRAFHHSISGSFVTGNQWAWTVESSVFCHPTCLRFEQDGNNQRFHVTRLNTKEE